MTNTWLLHNLLIPTLLEILQNSSRKNYASAEILGRELLVSGPIFSHPGTENSASLRSLFHNSKKATVASGRQIHLPRKHFAKGCAH